MRVPWRHIQTAFSGLRHIYWFFNRDAMVRSRGLSTLGRIIGTASKHHPSESRSWDTYYVTYEFNVDDRTHTREQKVHDLFGCRLDMPIVVYYLPEVYPPKSSIDRKPRELSGREKVNEEAGPNTFQEVGMSATATILEIKDQRSRDADGYCGMTYEFTDARGATWRNTTWVSDPMDAEVGSKRPVRYLPDRPDKNMLSWADENDV
ncbi:MAG: hypothetical protein QF744_11780 [SAR202 cluster bacterium]|jgi:hypothetical protein|nr:hypothetical protein [SAR202 cluster bacterium]|tara:strand:+ start:2126 stop:2743 length:618 start_codon:yes stop_codon:yes gene_type:complete